MQIELCKLSMWDLSQDQRFEILHFLREFFVHCILLLTPLPMKFGYTVGWGRRIHRLLHWRRVRHPNEYHGYDTKQSDGEIPIMLEDWGISSTPSLPLIPCQLCPGVVASYRALSIGRIELMLHWISWNWTVSIIKVSPYTKLNCLKWNSFLYANLNYL